MDVTDPRSVQGLIDYVWAKFGRIDYMFNNAGVAVGGEVRDLTLDQWRHVLDVNLTGVMTALITVIRK